MDAEQMIGSLIRGALGGRRKRSKGAMRFLTGNRSLLNTSTLLAAAGVAWGLYETATRSGTPAPQPPAPHPPAPSPLMTPPPLPGGQAQASMPAADTSTVPPQVLRVIRLTVSAARADGTLSPTEEAAIMQQARSVGAEALVQQELRQPTPLAALLAGVDPAQRRDLYMLAFAIVRADEAVSGAERVYLAQLAHQLGLEPAEAAELEAKAAARIQQAASDDAVS